MQTSSSDDDIHTSKIEIQVTHQVHSMFAWQVDDATGFMCVLITICGNSIIN